MDENASVDTRSNTDKSADLKKLEPLLEMTSESQVDQDNQDTNDAVLLNMSPEKLEN